MPVGGVEGNPFQVFRPQVLQVDALQAAFAHSRFSIIAAVRIRQDADHPLPGRI
jgi:hypothetical protein